MKITICQDPIELEKCDKCDDDGRVAKHGHVVTPPGDLLYNMSSDFCTCEYGKWMEDKAGEHRLIQHPKGNTITPDELTTICKTVVELTEIRQRGCSNLCVENFAVEVFNGMLNGYLAHRNGREV